MTTIQTVQGAGAIAAKTSVASAMLTFCSDSVIKMLPYLIVAVPLILLDLDWGVRAAKYRYNKSGNKDDKPRFSRALRGTFGKIIEYFCWCVIACGGAIAFHKAWIEPTVLCVVYVNEITSIAGHYAECKGIEVSLAGLWKAFVRIIISKKFGTEINPDEFIKDKEDNK